MALYYSKGTISYMSEITSGTSTSGRDWARMTIMIDILGYKGSISKLSFQVGTDRIGDVQEFKVGDKVEMDGQSMQGSTMADGTTMLTW